MPGLMWASFREGDRSEYLALYLLSALGVAASVPRQEDIGADFNCVLAKADGNRLTFKEAFLVQVKSASAKRTIRYGGPDQKGQWKKEEVAWLFGQELPMLVGIVDKVAGALHLYSTSNMWHGRNQGGNLGQVWLVPDTPDKQGAEIPRPHAEKQDEWPSGIGDQQLWTVPLGPPVVSMTIQDLDNSDKLDLYRKILSRAINLEQTNITYRRLGVHFSRWLLRIDTNKYEDQWVGIGCTGNSRLGANSEVQLRAMAPFLATLAINFKLQKKPDSFDKLKPVATLLDPSWPETQELKKLVEGLIP